MIFTNYEQSVVESAGQGSGPPASGKLGAPESSHQNPEGCILGHGPRDASSLR